MTCNRRKFQFWSSRGVDGPSPVPLFGSSWAMWRESMVDMDIRNRHLYGRVYGTYEGTTPVLVVTDPSLIQFVYNSSFANFTDQFTEQLTRSPHQVEMKNIVVSVGDEWRRYRSIVNRAMATSRLNDMTKGINMSPLIQFLRSRSPESHVNLPDLFFTLALQMSMQCLLGTDLDLFNHPDRETIISKGNVFASLDVFHMSYSKLWITRRIPLLLSRLLGLYNQTESDTRFFTAMIKQAINLRYKDESAASIRNDFLQTLIMGQQAGSLSEEEVTSNAVVMTIGAWGTIAGTLVAMVHELAKNPDQQEMLFQEVSSLGLNGEAPSAEDLSRLPLLESAICETLRLHPAETRGFRIVSNPDGVEIPIGDKMVHIPKGTMINVSTYALHHDPEFWPESEKFDITRFLPENKDNIVKCTFMAVGSGPRMCPGERLAKILMKHTMISLLTKFVMKDPTPDRLLVPPNSYMTSLVGAAVVFEPRKI